MLSMNWVDVSEETLKKERRQLLVKFGIDPDTLVDISVLDEPLIDPEKVEVMQQEKIAAGREQSFDMVLIMIEKPLRKFLNWQCPEWNVSDEEVNNISVLYARLFAKHFPMFYENPVVQQVYAFFEDFSEETAALIETYKMAKKYKDVPRKLPKEEPKQEPKKTETKKPQDQNNHSENTAPIVGRIDPKDTNNE